MDSFTNVTCLLFFYEIYCFGLDPVALQQFLKLLACKLRPKFVDHMIRSGVSTASFSIEKISAEVNVFFFGRAATLGHLVA